MVASSTSNVWAASESEVSKKQTIQRGMGTGSHAIIRHSRPMTGSEDQIASQRRSSALRFIVCLGVVSLFADMTYEGAHSIIGPYLKDLGATAFQVAMIAGVGEMLAASLR